MFSKIIEWVKQHNAFSYYFLISVFVTAIDITLSRIGEFFTSEVVSNTIGVVVGFIIQYFLCTKKVYAGNSLRTAIVFFLTWLLGLALADSIVYIVRVLIFNNNPGTIYFIIGKVSSIVFPFIFIYFLRKKFMLWLFFLSNFLGV